MSDPTDRPTHRAGTLVAIGLATAIVLVAVLAGLVVTGRLAGQGPCGRPVAPGCTRVLFLGNSYTAVNDLPGVFARLAAAGGSPVETEVVAPGGVTLADHATAVETREALGSVPWSWVVLQEQSQVPAATASRVAGMAPATATLADRIRAVGGRPILLETWAHRDGRPEMGLLDEASMQAALLAGYLAVGHALHVPIAPVGEAWRAVRLTSPELELWQPDGSHPTMAGTYLAACVLYASVFGRSPEGLGEAAGIPDAIARRLQTVAARIVLSDPGRWLRP